MTIRNRVHHGHVAGRPGTTAAAGGRPAGAAYRAPLAGMLTALVAVGGSCRAHRSAPLPSPTDPVGAFKLCEEAQTAQCATRVPHSDAAMTMFPVDEAWRWTW